MKTRLKLLSSRHTFLLPALALLVALFATSTLAMGEREPLPAKPCIVGGCSGELCMAVSPEGMASTCEWKPAYACYQKHGECKRQPDSTCGWTQSDVLKACLANPPGLR